MKKGRLLAVVLFIVMITMLFSGCVTKIPVPSVQEGRFDFSVIYEANGEERTYAGVYVCKYEGVSISINGSGRNWSGYIEKEEALQIPLQTNDEGTIYLAFGLYPSYFMADPDSEDFAPPAPGLVLVYHSDDPTMSSSTSDVDFWGEYGVRLISYEYASPIKNNNKEKWTFGSLEFGIN